MIRRPLSVSTTFALILLNAIIWCAFSIIVAANVHPALPYLTLIRGMMAAGALVVAAILLLALVLLPRHNRFAYYIALGLLAIISVSLVFDQFGLADLVVLIITVIPIILLVKDRSWYLQMSPEGVGDQKAA